MEAGKLRHRVTLQGRSVSQDASTGEGTVTWSDIDTVWAQVRPLSAREFISGRAELQEVSTEVVMRYRDDVDASDRATWGTHTYDIVSVIHDERLTQLTLLCREAV
jgi:SPP1 family predicted phage head-tail adaptor